MVPRPALAAILSCVLFCTVTTRGAAQRAESDTTARLAKITGQVLDSITRKPISLAEVLVQRTSLRGISDLNGRFVISQVPPGIHVLEVRRVGYQPLTVDSLRIEGDTTLPVVLVMTPSPFQLGEITVTPGAFSIMETSPATRQTLSRTDIESAPFGEDLFRAVNRLPGLSSGDYAAHFSIRGGRHDETLILLDGLEIYEPYHMKDYNEGALSIVDVGSVESVDLLTGGFSAKYGDKRSGVFNITSRTPTGAGKSASLGLSFLNARAAAEGTFGKERGSWLVAARRGFADLVLKIINKNEFPSPRYEDFFAVMRYQLHPRHALSLNLLHAGDRYSFDASSTTGFGDTIRTQEVADNHYGNSYAWLTLRSLVGDRLGATTLASAGYVTAGRDGTEKFIDRPGAQYVVTSHRDFSVLGLKQDWTWAQSNSWIVDFGFDLRSLHADYGLNSTVAQDPDDTTPDSTGYYPQVTNTAFNRPGTTIGGYLSNRLRIAAPLVVELGLRYDHASYTGDDDLSPRMNALLRLSERTSLRAGWGQYRQRQGIADLESLDSLDNYFPSELSKQGTLGFEHLLGGAGTFRLEGYYKTGSRLRPIYRNWKGGIDVFPESNEDRILVYPDQTISKGIELYYDQRFGDHWSVLAGYALAFADETVSRIVNVNDPTPIVFDRTHPGPQDQRHAGNLALVYRPTPTWSIDAAFTFHTGWPATNEHVVTIIGPNGQPDGAVKPEKLYGGRLPSYQRMDLRITRRKPTKGGEFRVYAEVINLTNHQNVLGYDYFRTSDPSGAIQLQRDFETWFTILPSIGVSWSGRF